MVVVLPKLISSGSQAKGQKSFKEQICHHSEGEAEVQRRASGRTLENCRTCEESGLPWSSMELTQAESKGALLGPEPRRAQWLTV